MHARTLISNWMHARTLINYWMHAALRLITRMHAALVIVLDAVPHCLVTGCMPHYYISNWMRAALRL